MTHRVRQIKDLCSLGEYIREKIDKRGLRTINEPLDEQSFEQEKDRIQKEVIEPMQKFLQLYKSI